MKRLNNLAQFAARQWFGSKMAGDCESCMHLQSTPQESNVYPIRLGTPEEFHALRQELPRLEFVQENMEGHFHLRHISEAQFEVQAKGVDVPSAFGVLAALFLQGKSVEAGCQGRSKSYRLAPPSRTGFSFS